MKAGSVRRSAAAAIVSITRHFPNTLEVVNFSATLLQSMNPKSMNFFRYLLFFAYFF